MSDKDILDRGDWINDRIILAVFKILREDPRTANVGGLQDVIPATKYGFENDDNFERFVQIINVRGNHWLALSNVKSYVDQVYIYDSYVNLSRKKEVISYPINVEQCVCQLVNPPVFINMFVANVQQQKGGNDCGLFAIANAVALCFGVDPATLMWKQKMLGPALIHSLVSHDLSSFLDTTSKTKKPPAQKFLFDWTCWVHCHCSMPDDGGLMVNCKKCKKWFHGRCESGNFSESNWICRICIPKDIEARERARERAQSKKARLAAQAKLYVDLRQASLNYPERDSLVGLYDQINAIALNSELPAGDATVGYLNDSEYIAIAGEKCQSLLGITHVDGEFMFIVIFREKHDNDLPVFTTLIHEMIHAIKARRNIKGRPHGKEYRKIGKEVLKSLKEKSDKFRKPYCDWLVGEIDQKELLNARRCEG